MYDKIHSYICMFLLSHFILKIASLNSIILPIQTRLWSLLTQGMEKPMAPHSSTLAWKIPWMEEPGRPQSMRLLRVGHD